jgi:FMN phosphatase YigB (HAD superfamily)
LEESEARQRPARLSARGIRAAQTLMVGDRLDNGIEPARAQGWQPWLLTTGRPAKAASSGSWSDLQAWLI